MLIVMILQLHISPNMWVALIFI